MIDEIHLSLEEILSIKQDLREVANIPNTIPFSAYYSYMAWQEDLDSIPLSPKYLDFTKNRYSEKGVPCGISSVGNFTRLSSATMWQDGQLIEVGSNAPRISDEGLLIEPQRTNTLLDSITVMYTSNNYAIHPLTIYTTPEGFNRYSPKNPSTFLSMYSVSTGFDNKLKTVYLQPSREGISCRFGGAVSSYTLLPLAPERIEGTSKEGSRFPALFSDPADTMSESDYIQVMYGQAEDSNYATSWIRTTTSPATRSPDILIIDVEPNQYISGEWDDGVVFEQFSGYAKFSGHGYIRNIEVLDLQGRPAQ